MIIGESIAVETLKDREVLLNLLDNDEDIAYYEEENVEDDCWSIFVCSFPEKIKEVLKQLDSRKIYYETTSDLPHE